MPDDITQGDDTQQPEKVKPIEMPVDTRVNNAVNNEADNSEQENRPNQPSDKKTENWVNRNHPIISTFANVIMAIGTICAVIIAARSLSLTNKSLELTQQSVADGGRKDSAFLAAANRTADATNAAVATSQGYTKTFQKATEIENRAFVQIDNFTVNVNPDSSIWIRADWHNGGKTPAYNFRAASNWYIGNIEPYPKKIEISAMQQTGGVVFGNTKSPAISETITREQWNMVINETRGAKLYLYGYAIYEDAFRHTHSTRFCGVVDPTRNILVPTTINYKDAD